MSDKFVNLRRLLIVDVLALVELGLSTAQGAAQAADTPRGPQYVIARHLIGIANLRTAFEKIIFRAGEKPLERLFHNLRASREMKLTREMKRRAQIAPNSRPQKHLCLN
jgi:hypothetical protein